MKKFGNGTGSVYKLKGTRSHPWTARKTIGWNEKGQPKYKYIGYYRTKTEAINALVQYNKSPYSLNGERLIDIYERFFPSYVEKRAVSSVEALKSRWKHLSPLYNKKLADLSRKDLQLFFDNLQASEMTKKKVKVLLKLLFDYSVRYDIIPPERTAILEYIDLSSKVETQKRPHKRITNEEIEELWDRNDEMSRFVLFLIYTGLRCGEFCNITEESIDSDLVIHIVKSKTAAGIRDIPISDKAKKLLPLPHFATYEVMKYKYKTWRKKTGFGHSLHDTRHTCISLLTETGTDERIIRSIVGHSGSGVTEQVYTHISIEEKRAALNQI